VNTLESAIAEFLQATEADGVSPDTLQWYRSILGTFQAFMPVGMVLDGIIPSKIRDYIIYVRDKYAEDSAHGHVRVQHRFWKWCSVEYGLTNPMRNIRFPAPPPHKVPKSATTDDIARLFEVCGNDFQGRRDRALLAFLADTGARASGVCGLKMTNLDMKNRRAIVIEKGKKARTVVFTGFTASLLEEWLKGRPDVPHVFYNIRTLEPLTRSGLEQLLKRLRKRAGVKGRTNPHSFRHSFAREYLRNGGDLATLQRIMGHADVSTTAAFYAIYTQDELATRHEQLSQMNQIKAALDKNRHER
jgi:site-specific recombinase XerD